MTQYKKQLVLFLIFLLPIGANAAGGNIDDIAKGLTTYFPKVSGKVTSVDQDRVIIQSENETGLSYGVLVPVYREGDRFYHPVTKAVLGRFEEEISQLEVEKVEQGQFTAKVIQNLPAIGDFVRLTAARIPIEVVSSGTTEEERFLAREFRAALEETGRFSVKDAAIGKPLYSITLLSSAGGSSVKIQMQNVKTGRVISDIESNLFTSNESDTIFESLQYKLLEKRQKGILAK